MREFKISPYTGDWEMSEDWDDDDQGLNSEELQTFNGLEDGDGDGVQDGDITIYPYPDGEPDFVEYKYDHLVQFSMKSIQKYNQDTGKQYQFVELEEACIFTLYEIDSIKVFFKASHDGIILNFKAMIDCPCDDVTFLSSPPDLQAIWVVPSLLYDSQSLPNYDSPAHNLEAQVQLLQV